eukprot:scaffold101363_cov75-Phaeocystis_antarctica.AAC.1
MLESCVTAVCRARPRVVWPSPPDVYMLADGSHRRVGSRQPSRPFYGTCSPSRELYMPAVVYHLHAGCACDNICASTRGLRYGIHMGNPVFYFFKFLYRTD